MMTFCSTTQDRINEMGGGVYLVSVYPDNDLATYMFKIDWNGSAG